MLSELLRLDRRFILARIIVRAVYNHSALAFLELLLQLFELLLLSILDAAQNLVSYHEEAQE